MGALAGTERAAHLESVWPFVGQPAALGSVPLGVKAAIPHLGALLHGLGKSLSGPSGSARAKQMPCLGRKRVELADCSVSQLIGPLGGTVLPRM